MPAWQLLLDVVGLALLCVLLYGLAARTFTPRTAPAEPRMRRRQGS